MSEHNNVVNGSILANNTGEETAGTIRTYGSLPDSFKAITPNNIVELLVVVEQLDPSTKCADRGPFKVAQKIKINEEIDGVVQEVIYDLEKFSCDQLRKLCGHISLSGYGSYNKFKCRRQIARHASLVGMHNHASDIDCPNAIIMKLNSDLRKVNTFFHSSIFDQVLSVNRLMKRADHEDGKTDQQTYRDLAELYNTSDSDFQLDEVECNLASDVGNVLTENAAIAKADLTQFVPTTGDGKPFKKFINEMFALRKYIKAMMHSRSGEHENDPMKFVDRAMNKKKFSIHRLAVYYFFIKCEEDSRIDSEYQPFMREDLKGTSTSLKASASSDSTAGDPSSSTGNKKKKHSNLGVTEAATGIISLVAMLQDKNHKDIQFMAEQEKGPQERSIWSY